MTNQDQLEAKFSAASAALREFPLLPNGLISDKVRKSRKFRAALKAYSQAKADILAYHKSIKSEA
jgi:hypothetical protein